MNLKGLKKKQIASPASGLSSSPKAPPVRRGLGARMQPKEEAPSAASWMLTGTAAKDEVERSAVDFSQMAPEFRVPPDEGRKFLFTREDPLVAFHVYNLKIDGRWKRVTVPDEEEDLLIQNIPNLRPTLVVVWEGIDVEGFKSNKTGKMIGVNRKSLFLTSAQTAKVIERTKQDYTLTGKIFRIMRVGRQRPTYSMNILPETPSPAAIKAMREPSLMARLVEWYSPPDEQEQRRIIRLHRAAAPDDGDDD